MTTLSVSPGGYVKGAEAQEFNAEARGTGFQRKGAKTPSWFMANYGSLECLRTHEEVKPRRSKPLHVFALFAALASLRLKHRCRRLNAVRRG